MTRLWLVRAGKLAEVRPGDSANTRRNLAAQLNQFVNTMREEDLIVLPRKLAPQVAIGKAAGCYGHDPGHGPVRPVKWPTIDAPRQVFGKDPLHSSGAFLTICEISRNDAAARVEAVLQRGTDPGPTTSRGHGDSPPYSDEVRRALSSNYERLPEEIRKQLPLKRIWTLVPDEEEAA